MPHLASALSLGRGSSPNLGSIFLVPISRSKNFGETKTRHVNIISLVKGKIWRGMSADNHLKFAADILCLNDCRGNSLPGDFERRERVERLTQESESSQAITRTRSDR